MRQIRAGNIVLASAAYALVGTATAALAGMASSPAAVKGWRVAAWLLGLAVFGLHLTIERHRTAQRLSVATHVALAVALGAFIVAALGPFRAHWGEPSRLKLALLSLLAWPVLTGAPAFVVALIVGLLLDRVAGSPRASTTVSPNER